MKKTLSLTLIALLFINANAQRQVDLAGYEVIKPDSIFANVKPMVVFSVINIGPDTIYTSDTMFYSISFAAYNGGSIRFPDNNGAFFYKINFPKNLGANDTAIFHWKCPNTFKLGYTSLGELGFGAFFVSGAFKYTSDELNITNNGKNRMNIVYYFPNVGIDNSSVGKIDVFPNPLGSNKALTISSDNSPITSIKIYNYLGKLIYENNYDAKNQIYVELDDIGLLEDSLVYIQITTLNGTITKKIINKI